MKRSLNGQIGDGLRKLIPVRRLVIAGLVVAGAGLASGATSRAKPRARKTMQIFRNSTLPAVKPPESTFTGDVTIRGYFRREAPSEVVSATATFAPGARTPWKTNPLGQTVIVLSGVGWARCEGKEITEIRAGDVVWFPPGQKHWEGATPSSAMTYVAIQEFKNGSSVEFGAKVSDEEYRKGPSSAPSRR